MKKILLPTDFSENAWHAMVYAMELLKNEDCEFEVINAFPVGTSSLSKTRLQERETRVFTMIEDQAKENMKKLLLKIKEYNKNPKHVFRGFTTPESITNAVLKGTMKMHTDAVIMGTKGATGAKEIFMGSNTVKVINSNDKSPVLAVPDDYEFKIPKRIVFSNDFKREFEPSELRPLKVLAELWNSKIILFYLDGDENLSEEQLINKERFYKILKGMEIEEAVLPREFSVSEGIMEYIEKEGVNMLAMINNKHSFFDSIFREPVVKRVAFTTQVPFYVMPEVV